jgi:hypothetical protein
LTTQEAADTAELRQKRLLNGDASSREQRDAGAREP